MMKSIHPQNFTTIASIVLEICTRQNSSMKKKQRAITRQDGHDGPVSLHWLILGNLFKTYDPEEGLKLVAMSSNKKISKYFTK